MDEDKESEVQPEEEEDQIIHFIGEFGRWQTWVLCGFITFYVVAVQTWQPLVMSFHAPGIDYLCKPVILADNASLYEDYTYAQWQLIVEDYNQVKIYVYCTTLSIVAIISD